MTARLRITGKVVRQAKKAHYCGKGVWAFDRRGIRFYGPDRERLVARVIRNSWAECESLKWQALFGPCVWIENP